MTVGQDNGEIRVGVTGHMNLTDSTERLVAAEMKRVLSERQPLQLVGVSCLAAGSDSIFAATVVALGGELEVILPSEDYRHSKVRPDHAHIFDWLLGQASRVMILPYATANREAYEAANEVLLNNSHELVAVWDGQPAIDRGGTAAVVRQACERGLAVQVIWPPGSARQ